MSGGAIHPPLGDAGEIGMNPHVHGQGPKGRGVLAAVDPGATFSERDKPSEVNLIYADISGIRENRARIGVIFIPRGHDDHICAPVPVRSEIGARVRRRAFTGRLAFAKLGGERRNGKAARTVGPMKPVSTAGMHIRFMRVPRAISESFALIPDTTAGRIVHGGHSNLDPDRVVGEGFTPADWVRAAKPGVGARVCDSTNIFVETPARSESLSPPNIARFVANASGMMAATMFASNPARVKMLAEAGRAPDSPVGGIDGKNGRCRLENGSARGLFRSGGARKRQENSQREAEVDRYRRPSGAGCDLDAVERREALSRIIVLEGRRVSVFSRAIPDKGSDIEGMARNISKRGVKAIDGSGSIHHVPGRANRPDLERIHGLPDPRMVIPMRGEPRHPNERARMARSGARLPSRRKMERCPIYPGTLRARSTG